MLRILSAGVALTLAFAACSGDSDALLLGATTSVQDTGLLDEIVRVFEDESGYGVTPIVGGSGQILEMARRGELDVVITHSPIDEERFIADGEGLDRRPFMENFFLVAGPADDPATVAGAATLVEAFSRIATTESAFLSRGDRSGTHVRELAIWRKAGVEPAGRSWYQESAVGQSQNLLVANEREAYTIVDSSTFLSFEEAIDLTAYAIDHQEPNVYSVIRINPEKHSSVNAAAALAFADFLRSPDGQCLIDDFGRAEYGESLYQATCLRSNTGG